MKITKTYYTNGMPKSAKIEHDTIAEYIEWYINGVERLHQSITGGKLDGVCTTWYPTGHRSCLELYRDDVLQYRRQWHRDGTKKSSSQYERGLLHGVQETWGKGYHTKTIWNRGEKHGLYEYWSDPRQVYVNGEYITVTYCTSLWQKNKLIQIRYYKDGSSAASDLDEAHNSSMRDRTGA